MEKKIFITDGEELYEVLENKIFNEISEHDFGLIYKELWFMNEIKMHMDTMVENGILEVVETDYAPEDIDLNYSLSYLKENYIRRFGRTNFRKIQKECNEMFVLKH